MLSCVIYYILIVKHLKNEKKKKNNTCKQAIIFKLRVDV